MSTHAIEEMKHGGRKGGATTRARYGPEHFKEIGRKGGAASKARGTDYKALASKGHAGVLRNARNRALEEAALACAAVQDEHRRSGRYPLDMGGLAEECAERIRALKR